MDQLKAILLGHRTLALLLMKAGLVVLAFLAAFALRFDFSIPESLWPTIYALIVPVVLIKLLVFRSMGMSTGWWRYVSVSDAVTIFKANIVASAVFVVYVTLVYRLDNVPRSVLLLDAGNCFFLTCGIRLLTRAYREGYLSLSSRHLRGYARILVVGAGRAGQSIVRELRLNHELKMLAVGYLDDDSRKQGEHFQGVDVLGTTEDLQDVCFKHGVDEVIIAIPSANGVLMKRLVALCQAANVQFKTLPGVGDLIDGTVSVQQIREVDLEDLLGRAPAQLDQEQISDYLAAKRILITGAGGSIGSELCRQLVCFRPSSLVLYENSETALFHIENELRTILPDLDIVPVVGDIRDRSRVANTFQRYGPEVVFHAAAYKHVPMMEGNPSEAANNNVMGTRVLAEAAHQFGVANFVMVSTDKAVNPTNIMGTTKRAAELFVQNLARRSQTNFVTVRFGNVLGSNGSVIPTFREQIRNGGPVTVTHPEVTRYFMSISEAAQLVLQAGSMGQGGEIFLLNMGDSVKILDLAETMIRLSGFEPHDDIDIEFTGLRPGEKLYEELLLDGEDIHPTSHGKIQVAGSTVRSWDKLIRDLDALREAAQKFQSDEVVAILKRLVPEYRPVTKLPVPDPDQKALANGEAKVVGHP